MVRLAEGLRQTLADPGDHPVTIWDFKGHDGVGFERVLTGEGASEFLELGQESPDCRGNFQPLLGGKTGIDRPVGQLEARQAGHQHVAPAEYVGGGIVQVGPWR